MKYTLKNRPKIIYSQYHCGYVAKFADKTLRNPKAIEEWFEGFEKELRDYIQFVDKASRTHGLRKDEPIAIKYKIYKEFLGE